MADIFVASSKTLAEWGAEVGVTKQLFYVGIADQVASEAVAAMNAARLAGADDWKLIKKAEAGALTEDVALGRIGAREKSVDPNYYPRLRGARGIFKVKPENAERHFLVQRALAGEMTKSVKIRPLEIATYLIETAQGPAAPED